MKNWKNAVKPVVVISISILVVSILVGIIAYANCEEASVFLDSLFNQENLTTTIDQV